MCQSIRLRSMCQHLMTGTLKNPIHADRFAAIFENEMQYVSSGSLSADTLYADMTKAFHTAAQRCVPSSSFKPARPWITAITHSVDWKLGTAAGYPMATGKEIRKLRRNPKSNHLRGRLRDMQGNMVDSDQRAETLAECFAKVQWAVLFGQ